MDYDWHSQGAMPQVGRRVQVAHPGRHFATTGVITQRQSGELVFRPDDYDWKQWPRGFYFCNRGDWRYLPDENLYFTEADFQSALCRLPSSRLLRQLSDPSQRDRVGSSIQNGENMFHVETARVKDGTVGQVVHTPTNRIVWESDPQTDTTDADGKVTKTAAANASAAAQGKIDTVVDDLFAEGS